MAGAGQRLHAIGHGGTRARALDRACQSRRANEIQLRSHDHAPLNRQPVAEAGSALAVFYFEKLLKMAMTGIDGTSLIPAVTNIAYAILLVGFLIGLYQAALRGGDVQALAVTAIKYLVVAMIIANWATVFRDVNGSFNNVAEFIGTTSGAGDMFSSWMSQLQQQATNNPNLTFWGLITGDMAGSITVGLLLVAYVLYALAIIVFSFFYALY